ncbi:hypothetical protein ACLBYG_21045 [Methylobacterium sp. D53M]
MNPLALWLDAWLAGLRFWSAALAPPRDLPADVTDIREGHAIRARRAREREGRL